MEILAFFAVPAFAALVLAILPFALLGGYTLWGTTSALGAAYDFIRGRPPPATALALLGLFLLSAPIISVVGMLWALVLFTFDRLFWDLPSHLVAFLSAWLGSDAPAPAAPDPVAAPLLPSLAHALTTQASSWGGPFNTFLAHATLTPAAAALALAALVQAVLETLGLIWLWLAQGTIVLFGELMFQLGLVPRPLGR